MDGVHSCRSGFHHENFCLMALLEIKTYPEAVLARKAAPVETFDDSLRKLLDDMAETMYHASGIGLAATQIGMSVRALVIDASPRIEGADLIKLVNPVICFQEGEAVCEEGCLSVPDYTAEVVRARKIRVEGFDEYGKPLNIETDTFFAIVLQHEIDHLEGVLFIDHLGRLKRDMVRRKLKKKARERERLRKEQLAL